VLRVYVVFCQYQCNRLSGKTRLWNDLLYVEWDVKPYTLTDWHYMADLLLCYSNSHLYTVLVDAWVRWNSLPLFCSRLFCMTNFSLYESLITVSDVWQSVSSHIGCVSIVLWFCSVLTGEFTLLSGAVEPVEGWARISVSRTSTLDTEFIFH